MHSTLPWIVALAAFAALVVVLVLWAVRLRPAPAARSAPDALPTDWALSPRPVFSTDERRAYRLLREALPHLIVLSKLPLVRFCQPIDPAQVRYWFDLLGASHVTFAICSPNGRVLAAVDLDTDRSAARRAIDVKRAVLDACRVHYLRCPVEQLPSISELQRLVPSASMAARPLPASAAPAELHQARDSLALTVEKRRAERTAMWQDSAIFQDSFFAPDVRESTGASGFAPLGTAKPSGDEPRPAPGGPAVARPAPRHAPDGA